ncbi:helix-turn-helix domain-containing protein [Frateuria sp. Soil773]|uniref:helix-turn-helix domain-containing protein n=1 Tax=Frateuria sp. Soil773 TaxID=1736407 RepID=UPI00138F21B5|nr:helix-turn-helix domain-containing protein [Frateuria sp. Soil773]
MSPHRAAQRRAKIVKLSAAGTSGSDIARLLGISRQRVAQLRDAEQVVRFDPPHVARRKAIPDLIRQGLCGSAMAPHLGCKPEVVLADIRTMSAKGELSTPLRMQLIANRSLAMSQAKILAAEAARKAKGKRGKR